MGTSGRMLSIAIIGAMIATACGGVLGTDTTVSNVGGDRLPVQVTNEDYGHEPIDLAGTLVLESNGCWKIDIEDGRRLVVFPVGFHQGPDDGSIMLDDPGAVFSDGSDVVAVGGVVDATTFPDQPGGYWGSYLGFCDSLDAEIAVLDSVTPVTTSD